MSEQEPTLEHDAELPPLAPIGPPHSRIEDVFALLTGTFLVSLGLHLLTTVSAVTGGTAGLALLASYGLDVSFGALYLVGNLLVGMGMLVLFRHGASLGGFNVLALLAQERLGWRAGYVQMALDVAVILGGFAMVAPGLVLWSALGAAVLNLVLALNHRPGRYLGS